MMDHQGHTICEALRQFCRVHRRATMATLAGILWIIETCCHEIKVIHGQRLHRHLLSVNVIHIYL
jgi:hypothetical protein